MSKLYDSRTGEYHTAPRSERTIRSAGLLTILLLVDASADHCVVRTRLPEHRFAGTWIDERNSAVKAALTTARQCCNAPRIAEISDWPVSFTAYEIEFACD